MTLPVIHHLISPSVLDEHLAPLNSTLNLILPICEMNVLLY